jgi:hypothetical protein
MDLKEKGLEEPQKHHLGNLAVDERIILKLILRNRV